MCAENSFENAKRHYDQGNCLKKEGKFQPARDEYKKALGIFDSLVIEEEKKEKEKQKAEIWNWRGRTHFELGDLEEKENGLKSIEKILQTYEKALKDFNITIEINPEDFYAWYNKGTALIKLNRYEEAYESFKKASETEKGKKNPRVYNYKGYALLKLERYEEALEAFEKAIELLTDEKNEEYFYVLYNKGIALIKLNRYEEAYESFKKASETEKGKKNPRVYNYKGYALLKLERYEEAYKSFEEAVRCGPGDSRPLFLAAYARYLKAETSPYRERWNKREVVGIISNLERASYLSKRDEKKEERQKILYFLGFLYYKTKDFFEAEERLKECVSIEFESPTRSKARKLLDYVWNYKINPPWWRWWLFSPSNLWIKRVVFSFLILIICLTALFYSFAAELFIFIAGIWKPCTILGYLQGCKCWQIGIATIALSVFFLIWPNVNKIWIKDVGIELSPPPSFDPVIQLHEIPVFPLG